MISGKKVKILGMGKYLPKQISSTLIEQKYDIPKGWSKANSGVAYRHQADSESCAFMGARAAEDAMKNAQVSLRDIDLLLSASASFDYPLPNQASIIKQTMQNAANYPFPALSIDSTCLSFVAAFDFAARILDGKQYKNILIVSAEISSKGLNTKNWETTTLFGDAAVAAVLTYDQQAGSLFIKGAFETYSEGMFDTIIEGGGLANPPKDIPYDPVLHSFKMNGKNLLRMAIQKIPAFIDRFFIHLPINIEEVDAIIPHQASKSGLLIFKKLYAFKKDQVRETLSKYGNCIAASIPLTLLDSIESGYIKRGDLCFLSGTSAGFSIGGILIKY